MSHAVALVTHERDLLAWVLDLPGCVAFGPDRADLDRRLPLAIAEHLAWLRSHGEHPAEDLAWHAAVELDARTTPPPGGDYCFPPEKAPLDAAELEAMIARVHYAHAGLMAAFAFLPGQILDWEPPASAIGEPDPWAPEPRTIRQVTEHVLQLDLFYRESLRDGPAPGIFERVGPAEAEFALTIERLRGLSDEDRSRVWRPVHPTRTTPVVEEWTARKVIRRSLSHVRAHTAEILQRRTWLQLGVPRIVRD